MITVKRGCWNMWENQGHHLSCSKPICWWKIRIPMVSSPGTTMERRSWCGSRRNSPGICFPPSSSTATSPASSDNLILMYVISTHTDHYFPSKKPSRKLLSHPYPCQAHELTQILGQPLLPNFPSSNPAKNFISFSLILYFSIEKSYLFIWSFSSYVWFYGIDGYMYICIGVSEGGNEQMGILQRHVPKRGKRTTLQDPETKGMGQQAPTAATTAIKCGGGG